VVAGGADRRVAEDLVAEAFARAWSCWSKLREHPAPTAWVVRTALNAGVSRWRKHRRERPLSDDEVVVAAATRPNELDDALLGALRRLPLRQREVVVLRVFLDLDTAVTAEALGLAPGTVTAHLSRAISTLRGELGSVSTTRSNPDPPRRGDIWTTSTYSTN
jgi:RNA polymerase sigma-70 factor (ECF subfamily)